jgi:hypothetical protein
MPPFRSPGSTLHRLLGFRETLRTVGVRKREIGRIHAMCRSIRPLCDPVLTIKRKSNLVWNESSDTTGGEHFRCGECPPRRSGKRLASSLTSFVCIYLADKSFTRIKQAIIGHRTVTA